MHTGPGLVDCARYPQATAEYFDRLANQMTSPEDEVRLTRDLRLNVAFFCACMRRRDKAATVLAAKSLTGSVASGQQAKRQSSCKLGRRQRMGFAMRLVGAPPAKSSNRIWSIINKLRRPGSRTPKWRRYATTCVVAIAALIIGGAFLPKVTGPRSVITTTAADLRVIDGDTVSFRGTRYRLVGFVGDRFNA